MPTLRDRAPRLLPLALALLLGCGDGGAPTSGEPEPDVSAVRMPLRRFVLHSTDAVTLWPTALDPQGAPMPDARFTWTTSNAAVAEVNADGLIRARAAGRAVIRASIGGHADSVFVTVGDNGVALLEVSPASEDVLLPGERVPIAAVVYHVLTHENGGRVEFIVQDQAGRAIPVTGVGRLAPVQVGRGTVILEGEIEVPATGATRVHVLVPLFLNGVSSSQVVTEVRYTVGLPPAAARR